MFCTYVVADRCVFCTIKVRDDVLWRPQISKHSFFCDFVEPQYTKKSKKVKASRCESRKFCDGLEKGFLTFV